MMLLVATRIAVLACQHLSKCYNDNRWATAPEIAERYAINIRSVSNVLNRLKRAGLLRSRVGGTDPGYIFSRNPKEISMLEVIHIFEGKNSFNCCKEVIEFVKCDCDDKNNCKLFMRLNQVVEDTSKMLSEISVADYINQ